MNSPQNMMNSPQNMMNQNSLQQSLMNSIPNLTDVDLNADLNFDPAAVIDGEGGNDLNVSSFLTSGFPAFCSPETI